MSTLLEHINSPTDIKKLSVDQLPQLAQELREEIIRVIANNGGHLGASLGTAELTVALHYVFNTPDDRVVWDTGHQAHGHKILTDRRKVFHTIRKKGGISGFPNRPESPYDTFGVGHASTAISAALGMAAARDIHKSKNKVVAVVGDGALTGGVAFEGINNAGHLKTDLTVILNDNRMSIAQNVGALSKYLTKVTSGKIYNRLEADVWELLGLIPKVGGKSRALAGRIKESIKNLIVPGIIFEELGFRYFGPIDGHNVEFLAKTLKDIRKLRGPILLHIVTEKGKGVAKVDQDSQRYHAVGSFDKVPGDKPKKKGGGAVVHRRIQQVDDQDRRRQQEGCRDHGCHAGWHRADELWGNLPGSLLRRWNRRAARMHFCSRPGDRRGDPSGRDLLDVHAARLRPGHSRHRSAEPAGSYRYGSRGAGRRGRSDPSRCVRHQLYAPGA